MLLWFVVVLLLVRLVLMMSMRMGMTAMLVLVVLILLVSVQKQHANSFVQDELLLSFFLLFLIYLLLDSLTVLVDWLFLWDDLFLVVATTSTATRTRRLLLGSGSRWTLSLLRLFLPDKPVI